jgi:hypothetical protein
MEPFFEAVEALTPGRKRDSVALVLGVHPAGADA